MTLVGLDTMILIYATRKSAPEDAAEQLDLRKRTLILLDRLESERSRIVVSTVALSEVLAGLKPQHRGRVATAINSRFVVRPIDAAVASMAADLWAKHRGLPDDGRLERRVLKVDVFVVAAAKLAGARTFYSHDSKCRTLASQAGMSAKDLPTHSEDLFTDAELKKGEGESGIEAE